MHGTVMHISKSDVYMYLWVEVGWKEILDVHSPFCDACTQISPL